MQPPAIIIALGLALSTSALAHPDPAVTPAPLAVRDDTLEQCTKAITSFIPPTASDTALASWLAQNEPGRNLGADLILGKKISDVDKTCSAVVSVTPPASLSSAFSSYNEEASSWHSNVAPTISSLAAKCTGSAAPAGAVLEFLLVDDVPKCTNLLNKYNKGLPNAGASTSRWVAASAVLAGVATAIALV